MTTLDFMTVAQAAEALHLSVRAVQHRIKNDQIAATKIGAGRTSAYVISTAEVERVRRAEADKAHERAAALDAAS